MSQTPQVIEHLNPDRLNAFIDGELPPTECYGIEQHLTTCHDCTLRVLSATQLKAATARAGHRFAPPPEALAASRHNSVPNRSCRQSLRLKQTRSRKRKYLRVSTPSVPQPGQPSPQRSC
ncbi:zf-HC2 domain-containing protein [Tunturiibacter empetritectus]|uniref:anti-sigma factor family protein n=1 Tax=Tunturiibacter empetritectus TaxID=3069691 RepID=UPI003D9BA7E8